MSDDWRLENLRMWPRLRGLEWIRKPYAAYRAGWEHDHCAACNKKLVEPQVEGEDAAHEGYATTSGYERGADYEWLCVDCFSDFKSEMDWREGSA